MFLEPNDSPTLGSYTGAVLVRDTDRPATHRYTGELLLINPSVTKYWIEWATDYNIYEILEIDFAYREVTQEPLWRAKGARPANEEPSEKDITPVDILLNKESQRILLHEVSTSCKTLVLKYTN